MINIFNSLVADITFTGDLAKQYGMNENLAETAGLLHDIGGIYSNDKRIEVSKSFGLEILPEEEKLPLILHQKISVVLAQKIFDIHSDEVLNAIGCHSTLKAAASRLDMLLFVADKMEWDQDGLPPYINDLEKAADISIELAAFTFLKYQWYNRSSLKVIHPWLIEAYEDLKTRNDLK